MSLFALPSVAKGSAGKPTFAGALALVTSLTFIACGVSDDGTDADDKSSGVDATAPSASPGEPVAGRPVIELPTGAENVFEETATGDPRKDAVLADNANMVNAIDEAILRGQSDTEALDLYLTGMARAKADNFIQGYLDNDQAWAGTTRYFDRKVSFRDDGAASVIYCSDESDSYITNADTGNPIEDSSGGLSAYVLYNTRLEKSAQGVWRTVNTISQRGADQCQG